MNKIYQYCYQTEAGRVAKYMAHKTVSAESRNIGALSFFSIFLGYQNFTEVKPYFVEFVVSLCCLFMQNSKYKNKIKMSKPWLIALGCILY